MKKLMIGLLMSSGALFTACGDPEEPTPPAADCGAGIAYVESGSTFCVYQRSITEEGFMCPQDMGAPRSIGDLVLCGPDSIPQSLLDRLQNEHGDKVERSGPCRNVVCALAEACNEGTCTERECNVDSECEDAKTCHLGICSTAPENNTSSVCDNLACGDECFELVCVGPDCLPGGVPGVCNVNGQCVYDEAPMCDDIEACVEACGEGCAAPWYNACSEDGMRYCSDCVRECHGVELAEDPRVCGLQYWEVAHFLHPCVGEGDQLCLYVKKDGQQVFELLYSEIEGFAHQWGRNTIISLEIEDVPDPPQDASALKFTLVDEIETNIHPSNMPFEVPFISPTTLSLVSRTASTGTIGEREFRCAPVTVCDDLQNYLDTPAAMTATFEYDTNVDDPIILTGVANYAP